MKILVAHNAYRQRGGEDMVVDAEVALLRQHGHAVQLLLQHNDDIDDRAGTGGRAALALQTLWSRRSTAALHAAVAAQRPEVVHVHNTFPLLSPSLYWACAAAGVPVVQTLHNFRLACPQAMFLREGRVCEDCLGRLPLPAVRHGCYRGSRAQSAVLAGMLVLHRGLGTWQHKVARYIALNDFCRDKFIAAGLPAARLVVKPNFVDAPPPAGLPRRGFLFVGRLAPEKGIATLAEAWRRHADRRDVQRDVQHELTVAGSGPEAARLAGLARLQAPGALAPPEVRRLMDGALALVLPSLWYENFPRTLVEALAAGLPIIASRIGALAGLVQEGRTGLLFEPGNAADLARTLAWAEAHPHEMARMGEAARADFEAHYTPARNLAQLLAIYRQAIATGAAAAPPAGR
jgi:glycosyltransferase involved in cell wall biosynthesis